MMSADLRKQKRNISPTQLREQMNELLNSATFEVDQKQCVNTAICIADENDKYKLIEMLQYVPEKIGQIGGQKSPNILGSVGDLHEDRVELIKETYCLYQDNLLGQLVCQSTLFPYYCRVQLGENYDKYTLGKVMHVFEDYIYVNMDGKLVNEAAYEISTKKLDLSKTPSTGRRQRLDTPIRRNSATSLLRCSEGARNNSTLQNRYNLPGSVRRYNSKDNLKTNTNKIYKFVKILYE